MAKSTLARGAGKAARSRKGTTTKPAVRSLPRVARQTKPAPAKPAASGRMKAGADSQTVGFRMPPKIATAIKKEAARRGLTISALFLEMWTAYRSKG